MNRRNPGSDPLDAGAIRAALGARASEVDVEVLARCTSTNALLLDAPLGARTSLLAAELQSAGRGRRGRRWHSPAGAGLTFSLARRMHCPTAALAGLSLAAGVAAARALRALGAAEVALKWPNDLVARGAKLGGILVETRAQNGALRAVVGLGVNCHATPALAAKLARSVIALQDLVPAPPSRNALAGRIAAELLGVLDAVEQDGFAPLRAAWDLLHAHAGKRVRVRLADGRVISGIAAGVAGDGALQLRTRRGLREVHAARAVHARAAFQPEKPT